MELKEGMNFAQLLNLPEMPSTRQSLSIRGDEQERVGIDLLPAKHPVRG